MTDVPLDASLRASAFTNRVNTRGCTSSTAEFFDMSLAALKNPTWRRDSASHRTRRFRGRAMAAMQVASLPDMPEYVGPDSGSVSEMLVRISRPLRAKYDNGRHPSIRPPWGLLYRRVPPTRGPAANLFVDGK